jgi:hypothetical protein
MAESDPNYAKLCTALKDMAQGELAAITAGTPEADVGLDLGAANLSQEEIAKALSRTEINEQYRKKLDDQGVSPAEIHAAQMQAALLSGMEKAARLKHRTRVAALVSGASRSYGQAQDTGYFGLVLPAIPLQQSA